MEVEVRIYMVLPPAEGVSQSTGNPWKNQEFIAETLDQHPKKISFKVSGVDKIVRLGLDKLKTGDKKKIFFSIDAREYKGRWYNEVACWDIRETDEEIRKDPSKAL